MISGNSRIFLGTALPILNVNHPAAPNTAITLDTYNVNANLIEELVERSAIYSKFKINSVKYTFVRDGSYKNSQQIASVSYNGQNASANVWGYVFPNTYNRLMPTITGTNGEAIIKWCMQQTGAKRFSVGTGKITKKVLAKMTLNQDYQGPSGVAAGASVIVNRHVKCPWLDLNNDLLDNLSLAQCVIAMPAIDVVTTGVLSTGAAAGLQLADLA